MKKFLLWSALAVLAPAIVVAAVVMAVPEWRVASLALLHGERFFEGRPSSQWAAELKSDWPKSGEILQKGGAAAVPVLAQALKDPDPLVRGRAARLLGRLGSKDAVPALVEAQQDKDLVVRCLSAYALAVIDREGQQFSVRALLDHWSLKEPEPEYQAYIEMALAACPIETRLDGLTKALKSDSSYVRLQALVFLAAMGAEAKPAAPALVAALKDRGKDYGGGTLGERAASALHQIDPKAAEAAVAQFVGVLKDQSQSVSERFNAAYALGRFHGAARPAVPALLEAARDKSAAVKTEAINALKLIDPVAAAEAGAIDF